MPKENDIKIGVFVEKRPYDRSKVGFVSEVRDDGGKSLSFIDRESHQQFVDNLFSIVISCEEK
jgi:hypothetical protein